MADQVLPPPQILSRCPDWVICVKPVGLDSEKAFPAHLSSVLGRPVFPVHRLDQNVGGLMVYALSAPAAETLSALIRQGLLVKEYVLICHGALPAPEGRMEDLLWKDVRRNKVFVVDRPRGGVREASLVYRVLRPLGPDETLVRVRLETGRSHQIRVQFASRRCPLRGDHKYGARDREKSPALFSCALSFPWQGAQQTFEMMPPWADVLSVLPSKTIVLDGKQYEGDS